MNLEVLHAIVKDYGDTDGGDDDNAPDDNKPYLLELPGGANHILVGDAVDYHKATDSGKQSKPRLLCDGTPHAFVFPFASYNTLSNIFRATKEIRKWLQIESPAAVLPTSLTLIVHALADLWPKWSADDAKRGHYHAPSEDDLGSQKNFRSQLGVKGSLVLRLNGDAGEKSCFAFGQKTKVGPLHKVSMKTAQEAAALWRRGPPKSMTLRDFKLMASVLFTTADACFPCWSWGNKGSCYHQDAVRDFLGLTSRADPSRRKLKKVGTRGRPNRIRARQFSADSSSQNAKKQSLRATKQAAKSKTTTRKRVYCTVNTPTYIHHPQYSCRPSLDVG